jgi:hypothetical protein
VTDGRTNMGICMDLPYGEPVVDNKDLPSGEPVVDNKRSIFRVKQCFQMICVLCM